MNCFYLDSTAFLKLFVMEPGTDRIVQLMESTDDNRKLISAGTPLEIYAALRRRERAGTISEVDAETARNILRVEAARMVQQPLNPAVLEAARRVLDHHELRATQALQLGSAIVAREMFQGMGITFVSADDQLLGAAKGESFAVWNVCSEETPTG